MVRFAIGLRESVLTRYGNRDQTILNTGCAAENEKLRDCFYETKDWRECKDEVRFYGRRS
ncbi:hypothetical protein P152DRAFT_455891 [Eremomyces bilateralis CBS 781.70]|uniref:CHCH domain-containing protein n=1 Tax=Eremomyces bilateralis CBS 781.70 TaxID=1392243 RepID=A0A6G1GA27_9PEZI|nr:uncharacterized protein P152DRAFT_455891 [Eremomyces bilateralis CBS 781.70]KAF1814852.1 hypothetical protein P152DRAFT_455891 [Eremomyces bilateralis CBS 781.70]